MQSNRLFKIIPIVLIQILVMSNVSWALSDIEQEDQTCLSPVVSMNSGGFIRAVEEIIGLNDNIAIAISYLCEKFRASDAIEMEVPVHVSSNIIQGKQPQVVLVKPEAATQAEAIADEVEYWNSQGYEVIDVTLYKGKALKEKRIIPRHYGVSMLASEQGADLIKKSNTAMAEFNSKFDEKFYDVLSQGRILGGHQLLEEGYSIEQISAAWATQAAAPKIASGVRVIKVKLKTGKLKGQEIYLINGHMPKMVDYFENDVLDLKNGTTVTNVTIEFRIAPIREDATSNPALRDKDHIGITQLLPAIKANPNSHRSQYYFKLARLGLLPVFEASIDMVNGDHLSDSLLNGMRESVIWGEKLEAQPLAKMLNDQGFTWEEINYIQDECPAHILDDVEDAKLTTEQEVVSFLKTANEGKYYAQIMEALKNSKLDKAKGLDTGFGSWRTRIVSGEVFSGVSLYTIFTDDIGGQKSSLPVIVIDGAEFQRGFNVAWVVLTAI